ncbi:MAG: ECF transporter S component [Lachnospiraceae bacterium]|nr:ECF transporter S component [Lachnospiraceae bacterium]
MNTQKLNVRYLTMTGMLSAIGFILMYFEISVPFMPNFIKMDLSELPALIGSFAFGPVCGILICLIKNVLHLTVSNTAFVGELANFIMGAVFVGTAGFLYGRKKTKKTASIAAFTGALLMGIASIPINYFVTYPFYYNFMPKEAILAAYQAIIPSMGSILQSLICFNCPFTFAKGMISVVITLLVYKHLSPILKGRTQSYYSIL